MTETKNIYKFENDLLNSGIVNICGVDEAGRGPLAGPVVVASCILDPNYVIEGLGDSKKLSEKKRNILFEEIKKHALSYKIIFITPKDIDKHNIYQATKLGMIESIRQLPIKPGHALIDAMPMDIEIPTTSIIKGDALSASIGAASILAKVSRDIYMDELDLKYPMYGFKQHKGYPTKMHLETLEKHGPCEEHRKSYGPVKKFFVTQLELEI